MKTWVFMQGGYFNGSLYGVMEEEHLPDEILLHHYENPVAKMAGVTILGITQKGPDDVTVVERYRKMPSTENTKAYYNYSGRVDPSKVRKIITDPEANEYVLEEISEEDDSEGSDDV